MKYIIPSFRSDYQIDIVNESMHWWEFCDLVSGFTDKALMSRVREIRNMDLSLYKDPKSRQQIIEAKKSVALPTDEPEFTEEEMQMIQEFEALFG